MMKVMMFLSMMLFQETTTPEPKPFVQEMSVNDKAVLDICNAERARYGMQPLVYDPVMSYRCSWHCQRQINFNSMHHAAGVRENVAVGQRTGQEVARTWLNSSGHRAAILNRGYTKMGIAGHYSRNGVIYWTQRFE